MSDPATEFGTTFRNETPVLILDALLSSSDALDVDELAARTGCHRSTLYEYLPGLEDAQLVEAAVDELDRKHYSLASSEQTQFLVGLNDALDDQRREIRANVEEATDNFYR